MRGSGVTVALFALFVGVSAHAHAEAPGYAPPPMPYPPGVHLFPIVVVGHPSDLKVTLSTEEYGKPFLYCEGRCEALAYKGEYWIGARSTPHTAAGQKRIRLADSSTIDVRPRKKDAQSTPTTVGLALLGSGLGMFALALLTAENENSSGDRASYLPATLFIGSVFTTAAGLVLLLGDSSDTTIPDVEITEAR
jgi:hypothetical protein